MQRIRPQVASLLRHLEECLLLSEGGDENATLDDLLEEEFRGIAATGRVCDRTELLRSMRVEPNSDYLEMEEFEVSILTMDHLANMVAMTNYVARHRVGSRVVSSRHASVWMNTGDRWRMRFHQATLLEPQSRTPQSVVQPPRAFTAMR